MKVRRVSRNIWTNDAMTSGFSGPLRFILLSLFFVILSISEVLNIHKLKEFSLLGSPLLGELVETYGSMML